MDTFIPGFDFDKWSPDKSDLTRWYYDLAKYLKAHPIPGDDTLAKLIADYFDKHPISGDFYGPDNQPPYPVTSVNGQTGDVVIETTGGGPADAYSPSNPPPYPVTSVNGKTGVVTVKTTDVINGGTPEITAEIFVDESENYPDNGGGPSDAYTPSNPPPYPVTSVNGQTGAVTIDVSGGPSDAYTPSNPPPYPVTSVNGQTGDVTIAATGVTITKLWTNPSPDVNFNSGTINDVSVKDYDLWLVLYRVRERNPESLSQIGLPTVPIRLINVTGSNKTAMRTLTPNSNSISVETAEYDGSNNNAFLVPTVIYGIKGVA